MQPRALHVTAVWMLILANLFWGMSFPLIKAIVFAHRAVMPEGGGWFITAMTVAPRFLLATVVMIALGWRRLRGTTPRERRQGVLLGVSAALGTVLQNDGLQHTAASTSAFLTQLYAVLIPVYLALRMRRGPPARVWLCCALVLAGVAVLARLDLRDLRLGRGEAETLLCSFFFGWQILILGHGGFAGNRVWPVTTVMFATEAAIFTVMAGATAPEPAALLGPFSSETWMLCTGLLTVFCTLGSFTLMNRWQPQLTPTEAGLIYCIEPVFASAMALFLPGWFSAWGGLPYANEQLTWHLLAGGGLVTLANLLLQRRPATAVV